MFSRSGLRIQWIISVYSRSHWIEIWTAFIAELLAHSPQVTPLSTLQDGCNLPNSCKQKPLLTVSPSFLEPISNITCLMGRAHLWYQALLQASVAFLGSMMTSTWGLAASRQAQWSWHESWRDSAQRRLQDHSVALYVPQSSLSEICNPALHATNYNTQWLIKVRALYHARWHWTWGLWSFELCICG